MNWYSIFYWLTVADSVKSVLYVFGTLMAGFCVVCFLVFAFSRDSDDWTAAPGGSAERAKKWLWWSLPFTMFLWIAWAALPTKRDSLLIIAGGGSLEFLTTDTIGKQLPGELSNFVLTELKSMSKEAQVELNISSQKDKVIESAKQMTSAELLEKIKNDSTFAKIILE